MNKQVDKLVPEAFKTPDIPEPQPAQATPSDEQLLNARNRRLLELRKRSGLRSTQLSQRDDKLGA